MNLSIIKKTEYKTAGIFLVASFLWIVFSDILLFDNIEIKSFQKNISIIKGLIYISIASFMIFYILKRDLKKIRLYINTLKQTDEYFYNYFKSNNIPAMIVEPETLEIIDTNDAFLKLYNLKYSDLKNLKVNDIMTFDYFQYNSSIQSGNINYNRYFRTTSRIINGVMADVEILIAPIYLNGKMLLQIVINDISEKMKMQKSLEESEIKYKTLVENIPDIIYILSIKNGIKYISPKIFSFLSIDENNYNDSSDLIFNKVLNEDKQILLQFRKKLIDYLEPGEVTYRIKDNQNNIKIINDRVFKIFHNNEDLIIEGILSDYTEKFKMISVLQEANQKVNDSLKLKNIILSNLNHELRTPLNGIIGFARLLQKKNHLDLEIYDFVDIIIESSYRLNKTLNSMLTLNEVEAGYRQLFYENISLKEFLNSICENNKKSAEIKGIEFLCEAVVDIKFECDVNILNQILINLIDNALKFTDKGKVSITGDLNISDKSEPSLNFIISDTGIGINTERFNEIFEDFRQESEGINRKFEGIGLGLSIARKLTKLLGGRIDILSKEFHGSKFIVEIPLKNPNQTNSYNATNSMND